MTYHLNGEEFADVDDHLHDFTETHDLNVEEMDDRDDHLHDLTETHDLNAEEFDDRDDRLNDFTLLTIHRLKKKKRYTLYYTFREIRAALPG